MKFLKKISLGIIFMLCLFNIVNNAIYANQNKDIYTQTILNKDIMFK